MADLVMWAVFGIIIMFIVLFVINLLLLETTVEYKFNKGPWLSVLIVKAVYRIITRRQGQLYYNSEDARRHDTKDKILADNTERVIFKNCRIDLDQLKLYREVCASGTGVPLCYLETLFMPSLIILATGSSFKLSPLGLIHIRQTIKIHHQLDDFKDDSFEMACKVKEYRRVDRGIEVDIHLSVVDKTGFCSWEGVVTLLSRNSSGQKSGSSPSMKKETEALAGDITRPISVPLTLGVNYAKASGDWNPHHVYPWASKLLGYKQPIAHGMWMLSRVISIIQSEKTIDKYPVCIDAAFKRPLFMPGEVVFGLTAGSGKTDFSVVEKETSAPHLIGTLDY